MFFSDFELAIPAFTLAAAGWLAGWPAVQWLATGGQRNVGFHRCHYLGGFHFPKIFLQICHIGLECSSNCLDALCRLISFLL